MLFFRSRKACRRIFPYPQPFLLIVNSGIYCYISLAYIDIYVLSEGGILLSKDDIRQAYKI